MPIQAKVSDKPNRQGRWEYVWTEPGGRSRSRSSRTKNRRVAEKGLAAFNAALAKEDLEGELPPTLGDVLERYLEKHVAAMPHEESRHQWGECARYLLHHEIADKGVDELRREDQERYCADRAAGKCGYESEDGKRRGFRKGGPAAQRNDILCLNAALRWAVAEREFDTFTLANLHPLPVPEPPEPRDHWLTKEQVAELLAAAQPEGENRMTRLYRFVAIAMHTASRKEPIESLPWSRVAFRWEADQELPLGGRWAGTIDFQAPGRKKTKKRRGKVEMSYVLAAILREAWEQRTTEYVLDETTSLEWQFRRLCKRALGVEHGPHILRHSWATWAASDGVSLFNIAGVLHDSVKTVERVYAKHMPKDVQAAVNVVAGTYCRAVAEEPAAPPAPPAPAAPAAQSPVVAAMIAAAAAGVTDPTALAMIAQAAAAGTSSEHGKPADRNAA